MARSMLIYREIPAKAGVSQATLITLHGQGGDLDQLVSLCQEVGSSFQVVALEGRRPASMDVFIGYTPDFVRSYMWYIIDRIGYPEPASFGASLSEVEQVVSHVLDRQGADGPPVFLLGYDQGAVLALTLACVMPEYLTGVIGLCGYYPEIRRWSPPVEDLNELPVLLIHDPEDTEIPLALRQKTVEELTRRNASLDLQMVREVKPNPLAAAGILRQWFDGVLGSP